MDISLLPTIGSFNYAEVIFFIVVGSPPQLEHVSRPSCLPGQSIKLIFIFYSLLVHCTEIFFCFCTSLHFQENLFFGKIKSRHTARFDLPILYQDFFIYVHKYDRPIIIYFSTYLILVSRLNQSHEKEVECFFNLFFCSLKLV